MGSNPTPSAASVLARVCAAAREGPRWSQNGHGNFGVTFVLRLSAEVIAVAAPRTGAERYFAEQKQDPEFRAAHEAAARRIRHIDELVRAIDARRVELGWTKDELARRAGMPPEAARRLFSVEGPNPTAATLVALADALDLELVARPAERAAS